MKTKVLFLTHKKNAETMAFFPLDRYNDDPKLFTCYAHIGQHSACHIDYANECELAEPSADYWDLQQELTDLGYDLENLNEKEFEYHRGPTPGEIKFGEGATHYKSFPINLVLKSIYKFKRWIKCPQDGLRYYR